MARLLGNYKTLKRVIVLILAMLPLVWKMFYVDNYVSEHTGTILLGATRVLANDSIIYGIIMSLFYFSYLNRVPQLASVLFRELAILVYLIYVVDLFVIINFTNHLILGDIIKYGVYSTDYLQQVYGNRVFLYLLLLAVAAALVAPFVLSKFKISRNTSHRNGIIVITILFLIPFLSASGNDTYVHSWVYRNVIDHNLTVSSEAKLYSDEFIRTFRYEEENLACSPTETQSPNIILLMVESLSSYQSDFFSGIRNWTPELDEIARNNSAYRNFYANGFTTEDGEIALLTGQFPIYPPASYASGGGIAFNGFYSIQDSLPHLLNEQGYSTEFLSTADLSFANTRRWANSIGFDYIEGDEHPYYEKWERFQFNSAPDEALYKRVLDRIQLNAENNYFIFIKTVSTHHPFVNPENKNKSEVEAFHYADKQIGTFYRQLQKQNFFDDGLLLIVGDHHAMVPLKKDEMDLFGSDQAAARVPLIIAYGGKPASIENEQYQQTDVYNGLRNLVSNKQCTSSWAGDVFINRPAKFITHRRGDNRNIISVFENNEHYPVKLNGNNTQIMGNTPKDVKTNDAIIKKINAIRIKK